MAEVRYLSQDHPHLANKLAGRIQQTADKLAGEIAAGHCQDWADYKARCGRLKGMQDCIIECQETEKELNG